MLLFRRMVRLVLLGTLVGLFPLPAYAEPFHIYIDADFSRAAASALAIERGIRTALAQEGNRMLGQPVLVIPLNHRGNSARSLANLKKVLADPRALAVFAGLHSPPLLAHRDFINENGILVLDPWAAAGPITRPASGENWIFRLSVDDFKAGEVMVGRAVDQREFKRPALLLENTGWGKANRGTMIFSLDTRGLEAATVILFDWGIREAGARIMLRDIVRAGADVILLVANASEGKVFCTAMQDMPLVERLPIISHWGITGGDFPEVVGPLMRKKLDLEFLQTRFSFLDMGSREFPNKVFKEASALFPDWQIPEDIDAPAGFVHAYDLTRILMAAAQLAGPEGDAASIRARIRQALTNLDSPVQGLVKTYERPFRPYSEVDPDAHEALGSEDLTFGRYGERGEIILVR